MCFFAAEAFQISEKARDIAKMLVKIRFKIFPDFESP